jgi:hypothetical protein
VLKLSILIAARDTAPLESSLVSILQNRPADCEIVVVHDEGYDDPYDLADEVRFVAAPAECGELARLTRGLNVCQAPVLHVLRSGAEVTEGWTAPALAHFSDPSVAAVAPLLLDRDGTHVAAAGLEYRRSGARVARDRGKPLSAVAGDSATILGPTFGAAFYRLSALKLLRDAFSPALGSELCDVDVALRLSRAGYRAVLEPLSRVVASEEQWRASPLSDAWLAERVFWRHAKELGLARSAIGHAAVLAAELTLVVTRPLQAGRIIGRLAGCLEHLLLGNRVEAQAVPATPARNQLRLDEPLRGVRAGASGRTPLAAHQRERVA